MKKCLLLTVASLSLTIAAQAEIVKPNIYQKTFEIGKSARQITVVGLKIKNVPSLLEVLPNPDYQIIESASESLVTVLEKELVVEASLRFEQSDAGEIEQGEVQANFPLSAFTEEELQVLKGHNLLKNYKLMKQKVSYSIKEVVSQYTYEYCADRFFDDYNRPLSECPRLATAQGQSVSNKMTISLK